MPSHTDTWCEQAAQGRLTARQRAVWVIHVAPRLHSAPSCTRHGRFIDSKPGQTRSGGRVCQTQTRPGGRVYKPKPGLAAGFAKPKPGQTRPGGRVCQTQTRPGGRVPGVKPQPTGACVWLGSYSSSELTPNSGDSGDGSSSSSSAFMLRPLCTRKMLAPIQKSQPGPSELSSLGISR